MMTYDIIDFGATGDGLTKNTSTIQAAIDQCHHDGGGQVVVPPGVFVTGSIFLKDNVELHLVSGAELKGSPDMADYNADDCFAQNQVFTTEQVTGAHLIMAIEATNVAITGRGRINGNAPAFFGPTLPGHFNYSIPGKRPGQMIYFVECCDVCVDGIELNHSPYWTLLVHGCQGVTIRGVRINNHPRTQNGDGIDIDCSRNVTISDCLIFSGDDSITLRANNAPLKDKSRICENVVVANCVLSTPCNAIRVGVGEGVIRNCTFSNLVVSDSRTGVCLVSSYSAKHRYGATIRNIRFLGIAMETVMPFYLASGFDGQAPIENIYFDNITATASKTSFVSGNGKAVVRNIKFRDIDVEVRGGSDYMEEKEIDPRQHREWLKGVNSAFWVGNADEVHFVNLRLTWAELDAPWRHCFIVRNSTDFQVDADRLTSPCPSVATELVKRQ